MLQELICGSYISNILIVAILGFVTEIKSCLIFNWLFRPTSNLGRHNVFTSGNSLICDIPPQTAGNSRHEYIRLTTDSTDSYLGDIWLTADSWQLSAPALLQCLLYCIVRKEIKTHFLQGITQPDTVLEQRYVDFPEQNCSLTKKIISSKICSLCK